MTASVRAGDPFPLGSAAIGNCPFEIRHDGFLLSCVLDADHACRHIASNGETVLAVWE